MNINYYVRFYVPGCTDDGAECKWLSQKIVLVHNRIDTSSSSDALSQLENNNIKEVDASFNPSASNIGNNNEYFAQFAYDGKYK